MDKKFFHGKKEMNEQVINMCGDICDWICENRPHFNKCTIEIRVC